MLLSVIDSLLAAIVDSGLDLSPLVCANTLYGLQVQYSIMQYSTTQYSTSHCIGHLLAKPLSQSKCSIYQTSYLPFSFSSDSNLSALLALLPIFILFLVFRIAALLMKAHGELCTLWLTGAFLYAFLTLHVVAWHFQSTALSCVSNLVFHTLTLSSAYSCVSFLTDSLTYLLFFHPSFLAQSEEYYCRSERCSNYQTRATRKVMKAKNRNHHAIL